MDYEKAYKEALEKAKQGLPINEVFHELKESEDQWINRHHGPINQGIFQELTESHQQEMELPEKYQTLDWLFEEQEQPKKIIEINGIRYKEVPAKTNDKICKDCDYFLDNGSCNLDDCPCTHMDNILERIQQKQPEVDLQGELKDMVARNAASIWCRCFKCDGIINATSSKCDKEKLLTCRKWYDGYRTALLALGDKRIFNARKEE